MVHIKRNILAVFPYTKRLEIGKELLEVFAIETKKITPIEGFKNLCNFVEKYKGLALHWKQGMQVTKV